jgi:cytochrome c-type biogenesis protein CcmH/NrfG
VAARLGQRRAFLCGVCTLLAGLVYLNALDNPFVYDDYRVVVDNPSILDLTNVRAVLLRDITRPLANVSYAIDRALWGAAPYGFHVTNVLLHMLNVMLLFQLAWRMAEDEGRRPALVATATAVLFGVHPIMTEAVGFISGRSEVLCAAFVLSAIICGRRWLRGGLKWAIPTVGLWAAALATKETGAMFPFVFLAFDWLGVPGRMAEKRRRLLTVHLPLIATAILAGLARVVLFTRIEYPGQTMIVWSHLLVAVDVVRRYVGLILIPVHQSVFHDVPTIRNVSDPRLLMAIGTAVLMVALVWRASRVAGLASVGTFWFVLFLVPSSMLIVLNQGEPMAEHRVYLASAGLFLAAGAGFERFALWLNRAARPVRLLACGAVTMTVLTLCAGTLLRNSVWSDPVVLWQESVDLAPNHFRPRLGLGDALRAAGRPGEAADQFRAALQAGSEEEWTYVRLGLALAEVGRLPEAAATFTQLERRNPQSALAAIGLGIVAMASRQPDRARRYFAEAIEREPANVQARQSLARLEELKPSRPAEALRLCEEIQRLAPWTPGNDECIQRNRSRIASGSSAR